MSSLIFYTSAEEILVAMDTLAVCDEAGTPLLFTTKFYPVPHLRGLICGTGIGQFVIDWFVDVNTRMVVDDILQLDSHASRSLRELWQAKYTNFPLASTVTVYHFGFGADGVPCAFAYRSEQGFESDRLRIGGIGIKPPTDVPEKCTFPTDLKNLMLSQRQRESAKPAGERVYIGGEILVCHMTKDKTVIFSSDTFPDREDARKIMFRQVER